MPETPLAYFISFTTYGTRLHGDSEGSIDHRQNVFGTPFLPPDPRRHVYDRQQMTQEPYRLDDEHRCVVRTAILEECRFRQWMLIALHVRSSHVHMVVVADREPEFVMRACKAHASKCLNKAGYENAERKRWTPHGSTRYLWDELSVEGAIDYTLNQQGEPMAVHDGRANDSEAERQQEIQE